MVKKMDSVEKMLHVGKLMRAGEPVAVTVKEQTCYIKEKDPRTTVYQVLTIQDKRLKTIECHLGDFEVMEDQPTKRQRTKWQKIILDEKLKDRFKKIKELRKEEDKIIEEIKQLSKMRNEL